MPRLSKKVSNRSRSRSKIDLKDQGLGSQETSKMVYYGAILAIIFLAIYVVLAVGDAIYNQDTEVVKSNIFIFNLVALILLAVVLFMEKFTDSNILYVKLILLLGVLGVATGSAVELHKLLESNGTDREDTTQFVISVIGLVFTFMVGFAMLVGNIMILDL